MKFSFPHDIPFQPARYRMGYVLPRLIWMSLGPCTLIGLSILHLESRQPSDGTLELQFLGVVAGILIVRWATWLRGDRRDADGCRIGLGSLFIYSVQLMLFAGALCAVSQLIVRWAR